MELKTVDFGQLKAAVKLRSGGDKGLAELAESVGRKGLICPLIVRAAGRQKYLVIDGRRRLEAMKAAGRATGKVPVLVVKGDEAGDVETALIANAVRAELDTWDMAETLNLLAKTYRRRPLDIAAGLGKSKRYVNQLLSLFTLPKPVLSALRERRLTPAHALRLLKLEDPALREKAFKEMVEGNMSVRDLEVYIGSLIDGADGEVSGAPMFVPNIYTSAAGSRMRFEPRRRSIRIEINLTGPEDLEAVIAELKARVGKLAVAKAG